MQILSTLNVLNLLDKLEALLYRMFSFLFKLVGMAHSRETTCYYHITEEDYNKLKDISDIHNKLQLSENRNIMYLSEIKRLNEEIDMLSKIVKNK